MSKIDEFVKKHAKKLPPDPCYGIEPTNEDELRADLTALISENYVEKAKYDEAVRQRDELKEALAEQKRLYFNLFDEEIRCMYCEAEISRGSAIILCKECAENTEL
jgi:hypothetical protein